MTIPLHGNWAKGFAYDLHTTGSTYLGMDEFGHDQWDTTRSEMGELVYRLKYQSDKSVVVRIVDMLVQTIQFKTPDVIVPVPSTNKARLVKPVRLVAAELGKRTGIPVVHDAVEKDSGGPELKNVSSPIERTKLLRQSVRLTGGYDFSGKNVLLFDDLYRSGATLSVTTDILYKQGNASKVFVLTLTKTRSNR